MTRPSRPAEFPDIRLLPTDRDLSWCVRFQNGSSFRDVSNSEFVAPITDNGQEIGELLIDKERATIGILRLILPVALAESAGRYRTWMLRESPFFDAVLVRGRLVKEQL